MTEFVTPSIDDARSMGLAVLQQSVLYQMYKTAMSGTLAKSAYIDEMVGLGIAEWKVLLIIGSFAPVSTKEIAERSSLDKPTISRTTEKLVSRKLVTSAENPGDRRKVVLTLTKAGSAKYVRLVHTLSSWDESLLRCLTGEQIEALKAIVALLAGRIDLVSEEIDRVPGPNGVQSKFKAKRQANREGAGRATKSKAVKPRRLTGASVERHIP